MTNKLTIIGDTHGKMDIFKDQLRLAIANNSHSIHVGDVGIGMPGIPDLNLDSEYNDLLDLAASKNLIAGFIRGNHDNPEVCKNTRGNLGDVNTFEISTHKVLVVAGAFTPDHVSRVPGMNWWYDEEINMYGLAAAVEKFNEYGPDIVISHTCPIAFIRAMGFQAEKSSTVNALSCMFNLRAPKYWFCGHFHNSTRATIKNHWLEETIFQCVDINHSFTQELE